MPTLEAMISALDCSRLAKRRDEAGDWRIEGHNGWIYEQPEGFYLFYNPCSSRAFGFGKKDLSFCKLTQDGDTEGYFFLDRLPTEAEAGIIRERLGIRRRRAMSEARLASLRQAGAKSRFQPSGSKGGKGAGS